MRQRLLSYVNETYHIQPVHPWQLQPGYAVLRHARSLKWFALLMNVEGSRLGLASGQMHEIVNLRVPEADLPGLMNRDGFLPAYHMPARQWVAVLLDGSVPEADLLRLLNRSYRLTMEKEDKPAVQERTEGSVYFGNRYRDQPLPARSWQQEERLPDRLQKMRKLVKSHGAGMEAYYFYQQALFMADYEDDFRYPGRFTRFFPTYQTMSADQLRGYFGWRTRYRSGDKTMEQPSYLYLYLYELLANVGTASPQESLEKICQVDADFGAGDSLLRGRIQIWSRDFVIYYGLSPDLLTESKETVMSGQQAVLRRLEDAIRTEAAGGTDAVKGEDGLSENALCEGKGDQAPSAREVFTALCQLSAYDPAGSAFYKKCPQEMEEGCMRALRELCLARADRRMTFMKKCFGIWDGHPYKMFYGAVFYAEPRQEDRIYRINGALEFHCRSGNWYCLSYAKTGEKSKELGDICHEIDRQLRLQFGFKSTLKPRLEEKAAASQIEQAIALWLEEKRTAEREATRPKIEIDLSRLPGIREDAAHTREQLLVEEEAEPACMASPPRPEETTILADPAEKTLPLPSSPLSEDPQILPAEDALLPAPATAPPLGLSEEQAAFLRLLVSGGSWREYVADRHLMLSILVDEINEVFYEEIGDTILEFDGSEPLPVEDYIEQVKELLK